MSLEKVPYGNKNRESLVVVSSAPVAGSTSHLIGSETSTRHEAMQFEIATSTDISHASRLLSLPRPSLLKSLLGVSGRSTVVQFDSDIMDYWVGTRVDD